MLKTLGTGDTKCQHYHEDTNKDGISFHACKAREAINHPMCIGEWCIRKDKYDTE